MCRLVVFVLVIVLQVCVSSADSPPVTDEAPVNLEWVAGAYRELKEKVVGTSEVVAELASMYYEDHVKPMTDPYVEWAKDTTRSLWGRIKDRVSSYTST
ncbi:apolipoprotein C-IV [Brachyhypopomus gauderio]|uniref:apolipoprotein C-IV n=1 Tax=Brachyhypopomus gauderio TaxID=698409 RepID=UPI0040423D05